MGFRCNSVARVILERLIIMRGSCKKHLNYLKTKQQPIQNEKEIEEDEDVQEEEVEEVEENTNQPSTTKQLYYLVYRAAIKLLPRDCIIFTTEQK